MRTYAVKEILYTLQGEGAWSGRAMVLCRFSGCNLWSGREEDRAGAICRFCDTDFRGTDGPEGGRYGVEGLVGRVLAVWERGSGGGGGEKAVLLTGGEPAVQVDEDLLRGFKEAGFYIALETNGTLPIPAGVDWVCVSPKAGTHLVVRQGDELKVVIPQEGLDPERLEGLDFRHRFVQPRDGREHWAAAVAWCLRHPRWRLGLQAHKVLGIP